jgi:hypothetical protein
MCVWMAYCVVAMATGWQHLPHEIAKFGKKKKKKKKKKKCTIIIVPHFADCKNRQLD